MRCKWSLWCTVTFRKTGHIDHNIDFEVKSVSNTAL